MALGGSLDTFRDLDSVHASDAMVRKSVDGRDRGVDYCAEFSVWISPTTTGHLIRVIEDQEYSRDVFDFGDWPLPEEPAKIMAEHFVDVIIEQRLKDVEALRAGIRH